jgi:hypothetical protein
MNDDLEELPQVFRTGRAKQLTAPRDYSPVCSSNKSCCDEHVTDIYGEPEPAPQPETVRNAIIVIALLLGCLWVWDLWRAAW